MWRDFLARLSRNVKTTSPSRNRDVGGSSADSAGNPLDDDDFDVSGRGTSAEDERGWREKFLYVLSLLEDPRRLLGETLVSEQLKLTLKWQAFKLERQLLQQALRHQRFSDQDQMDLVLKQWHHVNGTLNSLYSRLQVLRAIQHTLPSEFTARSASVMGASDDTDGGGGDDDDDEPDSLESDVATPTSDRDLRTLLRFERLAQKATRRRLESLQKQYDRLKEELEWRDSGHGDDLFDDDDDDVEDEDKVGEEEGEEGRGNEGGNENVYEEVGARSVLLKSWILRSNSDSRQSTVSFRMGAAGGGATPTPSLTTCGSGAGRRRRPAARRLRRPATPQTATEEGQRHFRHLQEDPDDRLPERNQRAAEEAEPPEQQPVRTFVASEEVIQRKRTYKVSDGPDFAQMRSLVLELQQKEADYKTQLIQMEQKALCCEEEAISLRELVANHGSLLATKEVELAALRSEIESLARTNADLRQELLHEPLQRQLDNTVEVCKKLGQDLNRERILRKKYFNVIEELKGKIRVYCRLRPSGHGSTPSESAVDVADRYTVVIRGNQPRSSLKEFHFDRVFLPHEDQQTVFEDTHTLIQSAFDGYNVCICAYGQTGSGKTHTIIGDDAAPGLAPRTFQRIFELAGDYVAQFNVHVSIYMLELYNDRLIDLLRSPDLEPAKLEIKKDSDGVVWVQGARVCAVEDAAQLGGLFQLGLARRHSSATLMNDRSSRSHLIVSVSVESVSRLHGTVIRGKVSLLDLAGSERYAKSGASAEQLREASSINKSLATLGDVISALAADQSFVPYRNSKLTMLMQDSLGGNAKTLLFVTASTSAYNLDESVTSLTYASRAKSVTNAAQRHSESKEIARLKSVIHRLRRNGGASVAGTDQEEVD